MSPRPALRLAAVVLLTTVALPATTADAIAKPLRHNDSGVSWREVPTGSTARLRGLAPVSRRVAWVS
ncbi:MAG TPA: hypothetical protein VKB14_01535, partial [Actinomycetales bacterium]|nr:hypothetical protein [Actinomycetales bacterium]